MALRVIRYALKAKCFTFLEEEEAAVGSLEKESEREKESLVILVREVHMCGVKSVS